jgi:hypothetical protein
MSWLIRGKAHKGKWKTQANAGMDEAEARILLEQFKRYNPGMKFMMIKQEDLFEQSRKR